MPRKLVFVDKEEDSQVEGFMVVEEEFIFCLVAIDGDLLLIRIDGDSYDGEHPNPWAPCVYTGELVTGSYEINRNEDGLTTMQSIPFKDSAPRSYKVGTGIWIGSLK